MRFWTMEMANQEPDLLIERESGRFRLTRRRIVAAAILCMLAIASWLSIRNAIRDQQERAARRERLAHASLSGDVGVRTVRPGWIRRFRFLDNVDVGEDRITALNLQHVDDTVLQDLEALIDLEELHLAYCEPPMTDADLEHLSGLKNLWLLRLTNAQIEGDGLRHLRGLTQLKELWLNETPLHGDGLQYLSHLKRLEDLLLSGTAVDDAGMQHLAGLSSLKSLSLRNTSVGDSGMEPIGSLYGLRGLYLNNTQVTDAGLIHLSGLAMIDLQLNGTQVSDAGLQHIAKMQNLQSLDLRNTQVTDEGVSRLRDLIPDCQISYGDED